MSKELEHFAATGLTLYAKPNPIDTATWDGDDVAMAEDGTVNGYYHADVGSPSDSYVIFEQAGGSPANTDQAVGTIQWGNNVTQLEGASTIDTLALTSMFEIFIAYMAGQNDVTSIAGGKRIIMYKQDGSTEKVRIDFDSNGEWLATTVS